VKSINNFKKRKGNRSKEDRKERRKGRDIKGVP
jgi:hypothetical protein